MTTKRKCLQALVWLEVFRFVLGLSKQEISNALFHNLTATNIRDIRPQPPGGGPVLISVAHYIANIERVDSVTGHSQLTIKQELSWNDSRLAWHPDLYANITSIYVPQKSVWFPDMTFIRTVVKQEFRDTPAPIAHVSHTGRVSVFMYLSIGVATNIDIAMFPFDVQKVNIAWGHSLAGQDEIDIAVEIHNLQEAKDAGYDVFENEEWKLVSFDCRKDLKVYDYSSVYAAYPSEVCVLTVARLWGFYVLNFVAPTIVVSIVGITGMHCISAIPNQRNSKLQLGLMSLMSMSVISLGVSGHMPRSNVVSHLHIFYLVMMGLVVSSAVLACACMLVFNNGVKRVDKLQRVRCVAPAHLLPGHDGAGGLLGRPRLRLHARLQQRRQARRQTATGTLCRTCTSSTWS